MLPTLEQMGVLLTGLALVVVLVQLLVMCRQTRLAKQQLEILEKQDELLARRADLEMIVVTLRTLTNSTVFRFEVRNQGKKGARDFYWHLYLPAAIVDGARITGRPDQNYQPRDSRVIRGIEYREYADHFDDPVYPSRSLPVVAVDTLRADLVGLNEALWKVVAEDGVFPSQAEGPEGLGMIALHPPT